MKYIEFNNKIMQKNEDGFFALENDKLAIEEYKKYVDSKTRTYDNYVLKVRELQNQGYISKDLKYTDEEIEEVAKLVYNEKFEFESFMAISKFYQSYAMKTDDKNEYLENYQDRIIACALELAYGDATKAKEYALAMIKQEYQPATPTFLNAGKERRGEFVSCYLLSMEDSLNSINYVLNTCGQLSKIGGGVAVNVSKLRARGETIKGIKGAASGVIPVLKLLEDTFSYVNQLGQRNGAGAAYLNIFHNDIVEFLDTKKINASEKSRLQTLSIGVIMPSKFIELAGKGNEYYTFMPHTVYKEYGVHLDDMDMNEWYDKLVNNPNVEKELRNPRKILTTIAKMQLESGYPYIFFKDNANKEHPLKNIGEVKMSNLCTEIMQLQETSTINDYGVDDVIRRDILCNLGSLNIAKVMENKSIKKSVYTAIDMLNAVSDNIEIANAPGVMKANNELHAIGLGAMNLHGYLMKNMIPYESEEAKDFVNVFFSMMNYYSIKRSMKTAMIKGSFEGFEKSDYYTGEYFDRYITESYLPTTNKVKELFKDIHIPTTVDWMKLKDEVKKNGLYNAYRLTIAPTQNIGYVQNATPSVAPITELVERRTYGNSTTYYPMPYLSKENMLWYKSAYNMDMFKVLDLMAIVQKHIDQGVSTTLYVDSNIGTKDLVKYYLYAHKIGLKALYYTRTKNLALEECVSCSI